MGLAKQLDIGIEWWEKSFKLGELGVSGMIDGLRAKKRTYTSRSLQESALPRPQWFGRTSSSSVFLLNGWNKSNIVTI